MNSEAKQQMKLKLVNYDVFFKNPSFFDEIIFW